MKAQHFCVCLTLLLLLATISTPLHAEWTATILSPSGSTSSSASGVSGGQQVGTALGVGWTHGGLWTGNAGSWADLTPAGCTSSGVNGTSGSQQAGSARGTATGNYQHASMWSGSAGSWTDLHPAGTQYRSSVAYGVSGSQQVGEITRVNQYNDYFYQAALWSGTAGSYVDLSPGFSSSRAFGVWGSQQVGETDGHAALWSGTAASRVDLNPAQCSSSHAYGIGDGQQVGYGHVVMNPEGDGFDSAILWSGTAASWINLMPAGCYQSKAFGVSGGYQVGYAMDYSSLEHAGIWSGTASSWVDLHSVLPAGYSYSWAKGIDSSGGTTSVAGFAHRISDNRDQAVLWTFTPVPEPSSFLVLSSALVGLCGLLRRRRSQYH